MRDRRGVPEGHDGPMTRLSPHTHAGAAGSTCSTQPHRMKVLDWGLLELARRDGWDKAASAYFGEVDHSFRSKAITHFASCRSSDELGLGIGWLQTKAGYTTDRGVVDVAAATLQVNVAREARRLSPATNRGLAALVG